MFELTQPAKISYDGGKSYSWVEDYTKGVTLNKDQTNAIVVYQDKVEVTVTNNISGYTYKMDTEVDWKSPNTIEVTVEKGSNFQQNKQLELTYKLNGVQNTVKRETVADYSQVSEVTFKIAVNDDFVGPVTLELDAIGYVSP